MNKKILTLLISLAVLCCFIHTAFAETCPYDEDYKYSLKKSLASYLKAPSSSAMALGDVKQMLNFYLSKPSITDVDCPPQISALVNNADINIPDDILDSLGGMGMEECTVCSDGTACGQKNQKEQTCTCNDVEGDGKNEYCYLDPIIPSKTTCDACPDGTACGQKNAKNQNCVCKDWDFDGSTEFCFLRPKDPGSSPTSTSQSGSTTAPVTTSAPTTMANSSTSAPGTTILSTTTPVTTVLSTTMPATTFPATTQIVTTSFQMTTIAMTTNFPVTTNMPATTIPGDGGTGEQCEASGGECLPASVCSASGSQVDCFSGTICCMDSDPGGGGGGGGGGTGDQCEASGGECLPSVACSQQGPQSDCVDQTICCMEPL
jgi:hypothetical protein